MAYNLVRCPDCGGQKTVIVPDDKAQKRPQNFSYILPEKCKCEQPADKNSSS